MDRIILRHLSGSKANQTEEFALNQYQEISLGRDPSNLVKFDPQRDDLVSRQHAKIARDTNDPTAFYVTDLNSSNGTFVNKQRISGTVRVNPGDVVQFGAGGPEFQFDLDPRPEGASKATRVQSAPAPPPTNLPQTRDGSVPTPIPSAPYSPPPPPSTGAAGGKETIGRQTVERMMSQQKKSSNTGMIVGIIAVLFIVGIIAAVGGYFVVKNMNASKLAIEKKTAEDAAKLQQQMDADKAGKPMSTAEIAAANKSTVVLVEVAWHLKWQRTGEPVYHLYVPNDDGYGNVRARNGYGFVACYEEIDGKLEPVLTLDPVGNAPIAAGGSGSGFVVSSDGFVLTNRHVAAGWRTTYDFPEEAQVGFNVSTGAPCQAPFDWVPFESKVVPRGITGTAEFEGQNDMLYIMFSGNTTRRKADLSAVSDRADVALIKVNIPGALQQVEINDNYESLAAGANVVVMGYPAVSAPIVGVKRQADPLNQNPMVTIVPDPTITPGSIQRVLRGGETKGPTGTEFISTMGDVFQLAINTTGPGNSGGPVFDEKNKVIGIYTYRTGDNSGTRVSLAVPIRFGKELMGVGSER